MAKRAVTAMIATLATGSDVRQSRGFSLVELLVVVTIMVLLAGLFPLALEHMIPARKLAATSAQLAASLRELQSLALASGRTTSLLPTQNGYVTRDGNGTERVVDLPADTTLRLQDDSTGRGLTDLTFFPDGSSSGGRFDVQCENKRRSVLVSRLMGKVREDG